MSRSVYRALTFFLILACLLLPVLVSAAPPPSSSDPVTTSLGAWSCTDGPARVAWKTGPSSNNLGGVGTPLPNNALAIVANDFSARVWKVWLYPNNETRIYRWDSAVIEDYGPAGYLPSGRVNPTGAPVVLYHDRLKAFYAQWPGDGGGQTDLWRVDFGCVYSP